MPGRQPSIAEAAREAFATGYALTEAPLTERAKAGCIAAVALACEHPHDPGILEATLTLGQLTGTWAVVYDRREGLVRKHARRVLAAWNVLAAGLDPADLVAAFRSGTAHPLESISPKRKHWRDAAVAAALAWLRQVLDMDGYQALADAIADAIADGMAEGEADALALAASRQGQPGLDIGRAFRAARKRMAGDHGTAPLAAAAAAALVDAIAGDAGRKMASLIPPDDDGDSSDEDAAGQVGGTISGRDVPAIATAADATIWTALGAGALALYRRVADAIGGTAEIDWLTAGGNVCPVCIKNEEDGPYSPETLPPFPAHPRCKCSTQSRTSFPLAFLAPFLP